MEMDTIAIIGIVLVGAVAAYIYFGGSLGGISIPAIGGADIGYFMTHVSDTIDPGGIETLEENCESIDGTWINTATRFGCYEMPAGGFSITNCDNFGYRLAETYCEGLKGNWECNVHSVGCRY